MSCRRTPAKAIKFVYSKPEQGRAFDKASIDASVLRMLVLKLFIAGLRMLGWAGVTPVRGCATKQCSAVATRLPRSFWLAMFSHAGAVGIELLITPEVLRITRPPNATLVQRASRTDIAIRRSGARGH